MHSLLDLRGQVDEHLPETVDDQGMSQAVSQEASEKSSRIEDNLLHKRDFQESDLGTSAVDQSDFATKCGERACVFAADHTAAYDNETLRYRAQCED